MLFSGGYVEGKVARTSTTVQTFIQSASWKDLPDANLTWTVPALDFDLFAVTFSARCQLYNASGLDAVRIRVLDNGVPMEPDDGSQVFCSSPRPVTYTGNWVKRAFGGNHTIQVQIWAVDLPPGGGGGLTAFIDDYTLELVVHHLTAESCARPLRAIKRICAERSAVASWISRDAGTGIPLAKVA